MADPTSPLGLTLEYDATPPFDTGVEITGLLSLTVPVPTQNYRDFVRLEGDGWVERHPTTIDTSEGEFTVLYDSGDTAHAALTAAATTRPPVKWSFRLTLTDTGAEVVTFDAYVGMTGIGTETDGSNERTFTLRPTGEITFA